MRSSVCSALSLVALVGLAVFAALSYADLPARIPTHWNLAGDVDGALQKPLCVFALIGIPAAMFLLLKLLPRISPRGFKMDDFRSVVDVMTLTMTVTLCGISAIVLLSVGDNLMPRNALMPLLIGAMISVLGNYLGKVRRNFVVGIRTPWTLASDEVWMRTHRVGGWLFVLAGIAIMASAATPRHLPGVLLSAVGAASVVSVVYSFIVYRRVHGCRNRSS